MSITLSEFILGSTVVGNVPSSSIFLKKRSLNQTQIMMKLILSSSIDELGFVDERIYLGLFTANSFQKFNN